MTRHQSETGLPAFLAVSHFCAVPSGGPAGSACAAPVAAHSTATAQSSAALRARARAAVLLRCIERQLHVVAVELLGVAAVLRRRVQRVEHEATAEVDLHRADAAVVVA